MRHLQRIGFLAALLLARPTVGGAQDTVVVIRPDAPQVPDTASVPRQVAEEVVRRFNAPATVRMMGRSSVPAGSAIEGDVAVLGGPLIVAGSIRGRVVAVNADVEFAPGGAITGDLLVVGGRVLALETGTVGGPVREYLAPLAVRRRGDEIALAPDPVRRWREFEPRKSWRSGTDESFSALTVTTGGTYNRIEGLPVLLGPELGWRTGGDLLLRFSAFGIVRTAGNLSDDRSDLGYAIQSEARLGRRGATLVLGTRVFDLVSPIEAWQLSDSEVGWATFLLHRDYRDYYFDRGLAGFIRVEPDASWSLTGELARTRVSSAEARDPWSILRAGDPWRSNPVVDEGHFTTLSLALAHDTRNDPDRPTSGWLLSGRWERGASDDIAPRTLRGSIRRPLPTDGSYAYQRVFLDARRYTRVSPDGRLNFRVVAGGWLAGDALPVHRRLSVGGPEPLPGYGFRSNACNATAEDRSLPALCDRVLATQVEYRAHLAFDPWHPLRGGDDQPGWLGVDGVDLVVFAGGGQAWLLGDGPGRLRSDRLPSLETWVADFGVGVDAGGLGLYAAKAFTDGEPLRFLLRLHRRF